MEDKERLSEEELSSLLSGVFGRLLLLFNLRSHAIDHLRHGQRATLLHLDNTPNWIAKMSTPRRHHAPLGRVETHFGR